MRLLHLWDSRRLLSYCLIVAAAITLVMCGCAVPAAANETSSATATATSAPTVTPTPQPPCTQLVTGATPLQSVSGVPGLQAPAGTYIGPASTSGGGAGQYAVTTYTLCFQGSEANIDGGQLTTSATPTSTIGYLVHGGWS